MTGGEVPGGLIFGIYAGSHVGATPLGGPPDQPDRITQALDELQGQAGQPFLVRAYDVFADPGDDTRRTALPQTPPGYVRYAAGDGCSTWWPSISPAPAISTATARSSRH
jgi:hypothetical protein